MDRGYVINSMFFDEFFHQPDTRYGVSITARDIINSYLKQYDYDSGIPLAYNSSVSTTEASRRYDYLLPRGVYSKCDWRIAEVETPVEDIDTYELDSFLKTFKINNRRCHK